MHVGHLVSRCSRRSGAMGTLRGVLLGFILAAITIPSFNRALEKLPGRDMEAAGRHLADALRLKDLATAGIGSLREWLHLSLIAMCMLASLAVVSLVQLPIGQLTRLCGGCSVRGLPGVGTAYVGLAVVSALPLAADPPGLPAARRSSPRRSRP